MNDLSSLTLKKLTREFKEFLDVVEATCEVASEKIGKNLDIDEINSIERNVESIKLSLSIFSLELEGRLNYLKQEILEKAIRFYHEKSIKLAESLQDLDNQNDMLKSGGVKPENVDVMEDIDRPVDIILSDIPLFNDKNKDKENG